MFCLPLMFCVVFYGCAVDDDFQLLHCTIILAAEYEVAA